MSCDLDSLLDSQYGVATTAQLLDVLGRACFESSVRGGDLATVWTGIYSRAEPNTELRLRGLDLRAGEPLRRASEPPLPPTVSTPRTPPICTS